MCEILILHDLLCDAREPCELSLQEWYCLGIELYHAILYRLEIALDCCYRSTDLVRYI